jgi:hypothetical protein
VTQAARRRRPRRWLELGGLAIGLAAGLGVAFGFLIPGRSAGPGGLAAAVYHPPVRVRAAPAQPDPAALDAQWVAYSDQSACADWAGGDGVSAIRLNSSQLAWFFSDTYLGPAGPTVGFTRISGFVNNAVVIQTTSGNVSRFVTMTGGRACDRPGGPGNALAVVAAPPAPGTPSDRYWDEDGIEIYGHVVKFYARYLPGAAPFVPAGTVIAVFDAGQLGSAGRGSQYGAVARPDLVPLPPYTPPGGYSPILWGAALLRAGNTVYVYGTQGPDAPSQDRLLYLARVPASELTVYSAWQFYAGAGRWADGEQDATPVQPPDGPGGLSVSSGFSVVKVGQRYWLIQAGAQEGSPDIDAYPASDPWGPFDPAAGILLYRDPAVGLDAAHDYRILYEARVEPALSTPDTLVISYNVNSEAVTSACAPMSAFTNTMTEPRFITVPMAEFDGGPGRAAGAAPDYPQVVQRNPSQWFDAWDYPDGCPPTPGLASVRATPGTGKVTLSWPDAGLRARYRIYLQGPGRSGDSPVATTFARSATIGGLPPGSYLARVVPVNFRHQTGSAAEVSFTVP